MEELSKEHQQQSGTEKLFNFRPLLFAAIFLCLGILFFYYHYFYDASTLWLLALLLVAAFCRSWEKFIQIALAVLLCAICFFTGLLLLNCQLDTFDDCGKYNGKTFVRGRVVKILDHGEISSLHLTDLRIGKMEEEGILVAYLPTSLANEYDLSDVVTTYGEVSTETEFFDVYGFRAEEIGDKIRFVSHPQEIVKTDSDFHLFSFVQNRIRKVLYKGMDKDAASVTMGILLGNTTGIEDTLYDNIRFGGIAHIFAVSGLHVGALFAFCLWLMNRMKGRMHKILRFCITAAVLLFYAGVCGFSSSVLRATVICLTAYAFSLLNMQSDFLQSLGLAAIFILLLNPVALFEVGFQLSFAACLGIALLSTPLREGMYALCRAVHIFSRKVRKEASEQGENSDDNENAAPLGVAQRIGKASVSFFAVSLSAQISTAPLLLKSFSYLSGWSLLLNCIFVPFISTVFSVLLLFVAIACLLPLFLSEVLLYLPSVVFSAVLLFFEAVDFSKFLLTGVQFSVPACFCYYLGIITLSDKCNLRKWEKALLSFSCILAFVATMALSNG